MIARRYPFTTSVAIEKAYAGLSGIKLELSLAEVSAKLDEFFRERLRGLLAAELPGDVVDACLAAGSDKPTDAHARALALAALVPAVRASAGEVFKRATNIAKEAPPGNPAPPTEVGAEAPATEVALFAAFAELERALDQASAKNDWSQAFGAIADFAPILHRFFGEVFVMVDDERVGAATGSD